MTQLRSGARIFVVLAALAVLVGGAAATADAQPAPVAGAVLVSGDVNNVMPVSIDVLRSLPEQTQDATFHTKSGPQRHTYRGARLIDVLDVAGRKTDSADESATLSTAVLAIGADGYSTAVAWGEVAPDIAGSPVLVAYTEDGADLARARLVVPGDIKGARYVSDLTELRLVDLRA